MTVLSLLVLAFPVYSDWQGQDNQLTSSQARQSPNQKVAYVTIDGMTCSGCKQHVKTEIIKLKGITDVNVSCAQANVVVRFNPRQTSVDAIRKAVTTTVYKVVTIKTN